MKILKQRLQSIQYKHDKVILNEIDSKANRKTANYTDLKSANINPISLNSESLNSEWLKLVNNKALSKWVTMAMVSLFAVMLSACQSMPNTTSAQSTTQPMGKPTTVITNSNDNTTQTSSAVHQVETATIHNQNQTPTRNDRESIVRENSGGHGIDGHSIEEPSIEDKSIYDSSNTNSSNTMNEQINRETVQSSTTVTIETSKPQSRSDENITSPTRTGTGILTSDEAIVDESATQTDPDSHSETSTAPVNEPDPKLTQQILLERARANSQTSGTSTQPTLEDGANVPAFQRLMDTGINQLANGQYSAADSTFTRAQRLAPQSSAVYFYLGQVALKRNQPRRAEAMARRGLGVAQTVSRRRGLWQVILLSGQMQNSQRVIDEAQTALNQL